MPSFFLENRIQIISIMASIGLLAFIVLLIRRRKLREEYSILWLFACVIFLAVSIFSPLLEIFASIVGIHYAPAALLLALFAVMSAIMIHYSIVITKLSDQNKVLIQELSLLRYEVDLMKEDICE